MVGVSEAREPQGAQQPRLLFGRLSRQVRVLAVRGREVTQPNRLESLQSGFGGQRGADLGELSTKGALDEQGKHAEIDVSAHLEVGAVMYWAKAELTLDDAEVRFDGVLGAIDGADTFGRFSDVVVSASTPANS